MSNSHFQAKVREDDVRPSDIAMALGGCWLMLAVIAWMAIAG